MMTLSAPWRAVTHTTYDSPIGRITLVAHGDALSGLYFDDQRHRPRPADFGETDGTHLDACAKQLAQYFDGRRTTFELPLAPSGSSFQAEVWRAVRDIPFGETVTYGELARRVGRPSAARAVGLAVGRNPICVVVPCHRVIGASGALTGYAGGVERKAFLLDLERCVAAR